MESITIKFTANGQTLTGGGLFCASNTVRYIIAEFDLGDNWQGYDSVRAVWSTDFKCISTVLDPSGSCTVPHEVLERRGKVSVNLVGSILEDDELTDRLTTYPVLAITVDANAQICGTETAEVTPSQFEQYVAIVIAEVEKVTGMTAVAQALPEGSGPTANYSDGVLTLGIPKGDTGATGNGISRVEFNEDYSLTFYFTDSEPFTTPSIRGAQGARGYGIASVEKIDSTGLVDTYRITFEDPSVQPTTFTVTNGEEGPQGPRGYTGETGNGIDRIELTDTTGAVKTYTIYFTDGSTYDFEVTDGEVTLAELASVLPTDTASGAIASFEDGSDLFDYLSCIVDIEPVQAGSGTPSPDNVRPITGWTGCEVDVAGVNLFDKTAVSVGKWLSTTTGLEESAWGYVVSDYIKVEANKPVFIPKSGTARRWLYDENKTPLTYLNNSSDQTYTPPVNGYIRTTILTSGGGAVDINGYQVEYGSTATPYTPYNGTTYPVSWQTEAGTVYGGTVDLVTGVLTVTHAKRVLDGTETWTAGGNPNVSFYMSLNDMAKLDSYGDDIKCDKLQVVNTYVPVYTTEYTISGYKDNNGSYPNQNWIYAKASAQFTTASEFKTWLSTNNVEITYPLATPTTYQLDPVQVACLLGQNNVFANCGNIEEVKHKADVQLYIDKMLNA